MTTSVPSVKCKTKAETPAHDFGMIKWHVPSVGDLPGIDWKFCSMQGEVTVKLLPLGDDFSAHFNKALRDSIPKRQAEKPRHNVGIERMPRPVLRPARPGNRQVVDVRDSRQTAWGAQDWAYAKEQYKSNLG